MTGTLRRAPGRYWRRRECWVPTWRTWAILLLAGVLGALVAVRFAHPFLAVTRPVPSDLLVVEGWCEDTILETALAEFHRGHYSKLLVTGGPLEMGGPLSEYPTFADSGAAILRKMAAPGTPIIAVPAPRVHRDRTYNAALALNRWFRDQGALPASINLVTRGPHARRSGYLFSKAMGNEVEVGTFAIPDPTFDANRWWESSSGVRNVISEWIAYGYVVTLFRPPADVTAADPGAPHNP